MEEILHPLEVPDGNHDDFDQIHQTGFCLRFPKIYNARVFSGKLLSGTSTYLEDVLHPPEVPDSDLDGQGQLH